jgi:hypothetical protein
MMSSPDETFDPDFASPADWAAMYRTCGLQIIPCYMPDEVGAGVSWKRPRLAEWITLQQSLIPDATFERWYGANGEHASRQNMGILTGRASGNIFVIDLDDQKGPAAAAWWHAVISEHNHGIEPETCQQNTEGGGRQLLFRARSDWHAPTNRTPIGVDIRGQGGFAVMPGSLHESGKHYTWAPGCAPFEIEIAPAPEWLLSEVEKLVNQYGGDKGGGRRAEHTASPGSDFDSFGNRVDGREEYMTNVVWAAVVDLWRTSSTKPGEQEQRLHAQTAYAIYERGVKSRLEGTDKTDALEREGRGTSEFWRKWRAAMKKWDTEVAAEGRKPRPCQSNQYDEADFSTASDKAEEQANQRGSLYECLNVADIKNMPDPKWQIAGLVIEEAFGIVYGAPGSFKSFIALDIGLSLAVGVSDWWNRKIEGKGAVIYIASEGHANLKFRIRAWEQKNRVLTDDSPFFLIRQSINFMKTDDVGKLIATVQSVVQKTQIKVAAVFVDTVSRVLPGAEENLQKDMTLFVAACDAVRQRFKTTVIGIHHTNRNGTIRGSTVFPGAVDFLVEVNREEGAKQGYIKAIKIKDAEDGWEQPFAVAEVECGDIGGHKSLVVGAKSEPQERPANGWPHKDVCRRVLAAISDAWEKGQPWSPYPQSKKVGRYAPLNISHAFEIDFELAQRMVETWLMNGVLNVETFDSHTKAKGIRVTGSID